MTSPLDTLTLADLALARELAATPAGEKPGWSYLAQTLERDGSNIRRSVLRWAKLGLVSLDPVSLSPDLTDAIERQFGERRSLGTPDAQHPQGEEPPAPVRGTDRAEAREDKENNNFLPHGSIRPSPLNPRKVFREEGLAELAASIGASGMLQPILVRPLDDGRYEIAAGERRWRAVGLLIEDGKADADAPVPVIIRPMTDIELVEIAIIENRDREDVHPLEEAEAYLTIQRLRAQEGGDPGEVTAELAERAGRTRRHIQKRIALASRLSPAVKQAFAMGDISLAQAQALSPWPHERQDDALALILDEEWGWETADEISSSLREGSLLAAHALFPLEAYDGETLEDEEGELVLTDRAQAERLQRTAFEALIKAGQEAGWAKLDVHDGTAHFAPAYWQHRWHKAGKDAPKGEAELHIRLDARSLKVEAVYLKHEMALKSAAPDSAGDAPDADGNTATSEEPPVPPYTKRHWIAAASTKTTRLQTAIAAAPPRYAMALTVLALGPHDRFTYGQPGQPRSWLSGHRSEGEDGNVLNGGMLAWRALAQDLADRPGMKAHATLGAVIDSETEALATLVDAAELPSLFAALIAAQCGSWPGYGNAPMGDSLFVRVLAGQLEDLLPPWTMDAAWLERFSLPQLARIADACIRPEDQDGRAASLIMPKKKGEAVKWILNHVWRDTGWTPPEMHFDEAATLDAGVALMLAGAPSSSAADPGCDVPRTSAGGQSALQPSAEESGCEGGQAQ